MLSWTPSLSLPLLAKELVEQAARKRTYAVRALYAALMFGFFLIQLDAITGGREPSEVLGTGGDLLRTIVGCQAAGIFLFLPAMTAGAIPAEKERDTLSLLFLTGMGPWEIILQKYLSRLAPMLAFLLLSLPLLAVCYALGGMNPEDLWIGFVSLAETALLVGAISINASAKASSVGSALLSSYLECAVVWLAYVLFFPRVFSLRPSGPGLMFPFQLAVHLAVFALAVAWFLRRAKGNLVRRAFDPPRNALLAVFRRLDGLMRMINEDFGGVILWKDRKTLPSDSPVEWRETTRKALGKPHYLLRLLLLVEVPTVFILIPAMTDGSGREIEYVTPLLYALWAFAIVTIMTTAVASVASERSSQTLDILRVAPLGAGGILDEKFRGLRRLMYVTAIPILTVVLGEAWGEYYGLFPPHAWEDKPACATYLVGHLLSVLIYLPLAMWIGLAVGSRYRGRMRAIMLAVGMVAAWVYLPCALIDNLWQPGRQEWLWLKASGFGLIYLFNPASILWALEYSKPLLEIFPYPPEVVLLVNFLIHGLILVWIRRLSLARAEAWLGRT